MTNSTLKALAELTQSANQDATVIVNKFDFESELFTVKVASGKYTTIALELNKDIYRDLKAIDAFSTKPELLGQALTALLGVKFELIVKTVGSRPEADGRAGRS